MTAEAPPFPPPPVAAVRGFMQEHTRPGRRTWWHGTGGDEAFFTDAALPGVWLADRPGAALWYATHPATGRGALLAVKTTGPFPDLRRPEVLRPLCDLAGLDPQHTQRAHARGTLYLHGQAQLLQAAATRYPGVVMLDDTNGRHLSLVVWDRARVHVLGRHIFSPRAPQEFP